MRRAAPQIGGKKSRGRRSAQRFTRTAASGADYDEYVPSGAVVDSGSSSGFARARGSSRRKKGAGRSAVAAIGVPVGSDVDKESTRPSPGPAGAAGTGAAGAAGTPSDPSATTPVVMQSHALELTDSQLQMMQSGAHGSDEDGWNCSRLAEAVSQFSLQGVFVGVALGPLLLAALVGGLASRLSIDLMESELAAALEAEPLEAGVRERLTGALAAASAGAQTTTGVAVALVVLFGAALVVVAARLLSRSAVRLAYQMANLKMDELIESSDLGAAAASGGGATAAGASSALQLARNASNNAPSRITEIAQCEAAFAQLRHGLEAFACFVPRNVVNRIVSGEASARSLYVRNRRVTIMFSDIAGFTSIAEKLSQSALVRLISVYMTRMCSIIEKHGGVVTEILGDGILVFWNAADDCPDHERRACQAAVESQCDLPALNKSLNQYSSYPEIKLRIGLHTGNVQAGNIGAPNRMKFGCVGDAVNLSSRLEGLCKMYECKIIISDDTYRLAKSSMVCRELDYVAVKGKKAGVKIYELLGLVSQESEPVRSAAALFTKAHSRYLKGDLKEARNLLAQFAEAGGLPWHGYSNSRRGRARRRHSRREKALGSGGAAPDDLGDEAYRRFNTKLTEAEAMLEANGNMSQFMSQFSPLTVLESK